MTILVRVAEVKREAAGIKSLRLVREDGAAFGPFRAGAHIDVIGPSGITRQYSICSAPHENASVVIAVKLETDSRGGSLALHGIDAGQVLQISETRNLLTLAEEADRHLLIGGGIGVTPLLSMAYELHAKGEAFELHYFVRSREEAAFLELLEGEAAFRDHVTAHVGVARDAQEHLLQSLSSTLTGRSHVYTCGPLGFMEAVRSATEPIVGEGQVHIEHFSAPEQDASADTAFTLELDTGEQFEVPADRSILAVLEDNGIDVFKSCEEGICGSCISGVTTGEPDHRDHCLSSAERAAGDKMALCVSRSLSRKLVIELY